MVKDVGDESAETHRPRESVSGLRRHRHHRLYTLVSHPFLFWFMAVIAITGKSALGIYVPRKGEK